MGPAEVGDSGLNRCPSAVLIVSGGGVSGGGHESAPESALHEISEDFS